MNVRRRITQGILAGAMVLGLATPTFAAGNLQRKFESANPVDVLKVATAIGEVNDVTGQKTFVSAVEKTDHSLRIQAYHLNNANSIVGSDTYLLGEVSDVDIARAGGGGHVVAAMKDGEGKLRLIAFDATSGNNNEEITRLGTKATSISLANTSEVAIVDAGPLTRRTVVTAVRTAAGDMQLDSWELSADGQNFTWLNSHTAMANVGQIALESDYVNSSWKFASAAQNAAGNVVVSTWRLDSTDGQIIAEDSTMRGVAPHFDLAFSSNRLYMVVHAAAGAGEVHFYDVAADGTLDQDAEGPLPISARESEIFDMGDGTVIVALIGLNDQLTQWEFTQSGSSMVDGSQDSMDRSATTFDGARSGTTLFYAIRENGSNNLFHQGWTY